MNYDIHRGAESTQRLGGRGGGTRQRNGIYDLWRNLSPNESLVICEAETEGKQKLHKKLHNDSLGFNEISQSWKRVIFSLSYHILQAVMP